MRRRQLKSRLVCLTIIVCTRDQRYCRLLSCYRYNILDVYTLLILDILYSPYLISVLSLCKCDAQPSACPALQKCIVFGCLGACFAVALPFEYFRIIRGTTWSGSREEHEREIKFKEVEFLLALDQGIHPPHFLIYSSFTYGQLYFRCRILLKKLLVCRIM